MATEPLLTIVVPTRNRTHTAVLAVQTLLKMPDPSLQVAVQDCSDGDETEAAFSGFTDSRLVYRRGKPVSMTANWNASMDLVTGEYVCFIGDDDGVHPEIVRATRWAKHNRLDAVASARPAWFCWSDYPVADMASTLWLDRFSGQLDFPDGATEVQKSSFGFGQRIQKLPRVYHGVVKRAVMEELRKRTGTFFDGFAPDFYSAHAVGALAGRYCMVDFPLTIAGASRSSNAGRTSDPRTEKRAAYMLHFNEFERVDVPAIVPRAPGYARSVCASMLMAFRNLGRNDLEHNVDLPLLYATTLMEAKGERLATLEQFTRASKSLGRPLAKGAATLGLYWAARVAQRPVNAARFRLRRAVERSLLRGVADIAAATASLEQHYGRGADCFPQAWLAA